MIELLLQFGTVFPMVLFLGLMFAGLPIGFSMGISGMIGLLFTFGFDATFGIVQTVPFRTASSYTLTTVACFVLMAELAGQSGITEKLFAMASRFVGHFKGGLAMATIIASALFGAISGSSIASAATMSRIAIPQMKAAGYSNELAAGSVAIAGTLAVLIPPSLVLIIYGVLTETSIGKLFLAGIIPGLLTIFGHLITIRAITVFSPNAAPETRPRDSWAERFSSVRVGWPFIAVIVAVFSAMYLGIITATEAGAVGASATFVVWLIGYRLHPQKLQRPEPGNIGRAVEHALKTTAMIVILLIGAYLFSFYITSTGLTQSFVAWVAELGLDRRVLLIAIVAVFLFLGLFLSQIEIMVLTLPILFPVIIQNGFDPVWFGIIVVKTVEIGLVSPPLGMNVYIIANSGAGVTASQGFRGVAPFIVLEILMIALLIVFPEIALFLPNSGAQ